MGLSLALDMYASNHSFRSLVGLTYHDRRSDQTVHENRIYNLRITCGESYPDVPPDVQFVSRVNLPFVNQLNGKVDASKLPVLSNWSRHLSIENVLVEIRKYAFLHSPDMHFHNVPC